MTSAPCSISKTLSAEENLEFRATNPGKYTLILTKDRIRQCALRRLQLEDLFFDRGPGDQPCSDHAARLADAVRPVDRLRFDRRIPPGIEQVHVVRRREVESVPARLETHEEERNGCVGLKPIDPRLAVDGLKYRFLKAKGLEYGEEQRDFIVRLNKIAGRNAPVIDLNEDPGRIQ